MSKLLKTDVLIVGAGPAGLSAAAAIARKRVIVVDENPQAGGQIWRAERAAVSPEAAKIIAGLDPERTTIIGSAEIFDRPAKARLAADTPDGRIDIEYESLIIATGARERFLPFPGWTLPGVFGAGGLQALVKGGFDVGGKRVVVAGTGPLLIAVADHLARHGARIAAIVEQAPAAKLARFAAGLWRYPAKIAQAFELRKSLGGARFLTGSWITEAEGNDWVSAVRVSGQRAAIECDLIACGFDLVPNTELARLVGCATDGDTVTVDDLQRTSVDGVFCAGEPTGIGGVELAMIEGRITGLAADGDHDAARSQFRDRDRYRRFARSLGRCFELRDELRTLARPATIVCRCEDVTYEALSRQDSSRAAKLAARCGMGPCQGRVCGPANRFLFGWNDDTVRPPVSPVQIGTLMEKIED